MNKTDLRNLIKECVNEMAEDNSGGWNQDYDTQLEKIIDAVASKKLTPLLAKRLIKKIVQGANNPTKSATFSGYKSHPGPGRGPGGCRY